MKPFALLFALLAPEASLIDGFQNAGDWTASASDGVVARVSPVDGATGLALRLDYDFGTVSGYALVAPRTAGVCQQLEALVRLLSSG